MDILYVIGGIVLLLLSILAILITLMQDSKDGGSSVLMGGSSDSYLSKNRGRTKEAKLVTLTKIISFVFFAVVIAMDLIIHYFVK